MFADAVTAGAINISKIATSKVVLEKPMSSVPLVATNDRLKIKDSYFDVVIPAKESKGYRQETVINKGSKVQYKYRLII